MLLRGIGFFSIVLIKHGFWDQPAWFCHLCDICDTLLCALPLPVQRGNTATYLKVVVRIKWESTYIHQRHSRHLIMLAVIINNKNICAHL